MGLQSDTWHDLSSGLHDSSLSVLVCIQPLVGEHGRRQVDASQQHRVLTNLLTLPSGGKFLYGQYKLTVRSPSSSALKIARANQEKHRIAGVIVVLVVATTVLAHLG